MPRFNRLLLASLTLALLLCGTAQAQGVPRLPGSGSEAMRNGTCRTGWQPPGLDPRGVDPAAANPLFGTTWYVDPHEPAWRYWRAYTRKHRPFSTAMMWKIASQPRFKWFGRFTRHGPALVKKIRAWLDRAAGEQPGAVPLRTVLRHQGKRCSPSYTGGGAKEDARSRLWYRRLARAVGNRRVVIAFEPDSLGTIDCLKRSRRMARMRLLRYGVDVLSKLPNARSTSRAGPRTGRAPSGPHGSCATSASPRCAASCST